MLVDAMYVCSSPFQVLTAIILATENKEKADLYINGFFFNFEKYQEILQASGLFRRVSIIPYKVYEKYFNKRGRILPRLQAVTNYLFPSRVAKSILPKECFYRRIYSPNRDIICRYLQFYHFRHRFNAELLLYEEGNSAYMQETVLQENGIEKALRRILYGSKAVATGTLLLYSPELFFAIKKQCTFDVKKINVTPTAVRRVEIVFHSEKSVPAYSAVILDTHKSAIFNQNQKSEIESIYHTIIDNLCTEVWLKRHPRELDDSFGIDKIIDENLPFEVLCTTVAADTYLLISYISTALTMPKILFDQEPYILLLYNLVGSTVDIANTKKYFDTIKKIYRHPERILIPETNDELIECIQYLNADIHKRRQ